MFGAKKLREIVESLKSDNIDLRYQISCLQTDVKNLKSRRTIAEIESDIEKNRLINRAQALSGNTI